MTIIYMLDHYPVVSQTFVSLEVAELRRRGFDVRVTSQRPGGDKDLQADYTLQNCWFRIPLDHIVWVARNPRGYLKYWNLILQTRARHLPWMLLAPTAASYVRRAGGSHVHVHFALRSALVSRGVQCLSGIRRSVTCHAYDIFVSPSDLQLKLTDSVVLTVTEYNRQFIQREFGVQVGAVVHCGVGKIPPRSGTSESSGIVSIGRLVPKKGHDILLRAVAHLKDQGLDLNVQIVGAGPEAQSLATLAKELGIAGKVRFLGALSHEKTLRILASAEVFVLACRTDQSGDADGLPVSIMEAMSLEIPVVSTDTAGIRELVNEETGWLAQPDDVLSLTLEIIKAREKCEDADRRVSKARAVVASDFSIAAQVDGLLSAIGFDSPRRSTLPPQTFGMESTCPE